MIRERSDSVGKRPLGSEERRFVLGRVAFFVLGTYVFFRIGLTQLKSANALHRRQLPFCWTRKASTFAVYRL